MPQLTRCAAALCLVLPGAAWTSAQTAPPADTRALGQADEPGAAALAQLDTQAREGTLDDKRTAAVLFAAGTDGTRAVLEAIDRRSVRRGLGADPVDRWVIRVPEVAASVLELPDLTEAEGARVGAVALEVLGRRGSRAGGVNGLRRLLQAAAPRPEAPVYLRPIREVVASAAAAGALDGPGLLALIEAAGPRLALAVLRGAANGRAANELAYCLNRGTGVDGSILNQLQRALLLGADVDAKRIATEVASFLSSVRPFERSEAALILGRIGDRNHVGGLIEALSDPSQLVQTSTLAALHDLTGMTISGDPHRWTQWHLEQQAWWESEGQALVRSLRRVPRKRFISSLATVATKRLYRAEISTELVAMLARPSADETRAVIAALTALRDPSAIPELLELREHKSVTVRASADAALQSMRGSGRGRQAAVRSSDLW